VIKNDPIHNRKLFSKAFNESSRSLEGQSRPSVAMIQNYCKNLIHTGKMESEIPIAGLVYIRKLLRMSGEALSRANWQKVTFTAFMIASKI